MSEKKEEKEIIAKNEAVESKTKESKKTKISREEKRKYKYMENNLEKLLKEFRKLSLEESKK